MAQQETYGNWLGPRRLQRQPGIYSVAGKMSPVGDFRPASPDSFEDDYDDVSMPGSEQGPPAKGVYLLAGPPGPSPAPSLKDPEAGIGNSAGNFGNSAANSGNPAGNSGNSAPKSRNSAPKCGALALGAALALLGLGWAALLLLGARKHQELRAELELLKSNFSGIWDSVQQEQTRLRFGIQQHQVEQQDVAELLCRALGGARRCGPGWRPHGSSCYSFSRDALSWGRARNACADLGAHLAVVNDGDEQLFLVQNSNCSSSCWLGLTEQEGTWRWVSGHEPTDTFWDVWREEPQEPLQELQELQALQRCGALGPAGRWLRAPCAQRRRWICERRGGC